MPEKRLRLILGDQLNADHSWFRKADPDVTYALMEVRSETDYVKHHIQKLCGFLAAMRRFAADLETAGHRVIYTRLDDPENGGDFGTNLARLVKKHGFNRIECQLPDEYRLDLIFRGIGETLGVPVHAVDSEHFLTKREDVGRFFKERKRFLMESFYRDMRKRYDILMTDGGPVGGKWNFDRSNRESYDDGVPIPAPREFGNDVADIADMLDRCGVKHFGGIDSSDFIWPVTREQSEALLDHFVTRSLPHFGTYQDAMTNRSEYLFHSRLSFALNTKMLHPTRVINAAIAYASAHPDAVDIAQLEGFVRQILGWREFMRGVYWSHMPDYATTNFFGHDGELPDFYWTAKTKMACLSACVGQSLSRAYAHHIQRLMVTGNFALLLGVHPDAVDAWYLGVYIDAVEWVEIVNTRGMSQFADGGVVATKPYIASANYIHKMSDYCDDCFYRYKEKTGERACPFNSLYWDFLARHREKLADNPRIGMMYKTWDRMKPENQAAIREQAAKYRENANDL